ncbi:MAG: CAP domain-containing protein [Candidatus Moraniibacteriota bacterium]
MPNKDKNFRVRYFAILPLFIAGVVFSFAFVSIALASGVALSEVITLANNARAKEGLAPLVENPKLSEAAKNKAEDMLKNDYFAHTSPDGVTPWAWIKQSGYQYKAAGENLAINFDSAKEQHGAWMKSSTHRANILNATYKEIGVAVVKGKIDGQESVVTVEFFGTPIYVAADRAAPVPPIVHKAPAEIKGEETMSAAPLPAIVPMVPAENIAPQKVIAAPPAVRMNWLDIATLAFTAVLVFVAFAAPMAFLVIAYESLITAIRAKNTEIAEAIDSHRNGMLEYHPRL